MLRINYDTRHETKKTLGKLLSLVISAALPKRGSLTCYRYVGIRRSDLQRFMHVMCPYNTCYCSKIKRRVIGSELSRIDLTTHTTTLDELCGHHIRSRI